MLGRLLILLLFLFCTGCHSGATSAEYRPPALPEAAATPAVRSPFQPAPTEPLEETALHGLYEAPYLSVDFMAPNLIAVSRHSVSIRGKRSEQPAYTIGLYSMGEDGVLKVDWHQSSPTTASKSICFPVDTTKVLANRAHGESS